MNESQSIYLSGFCANSFCCCLFHHSPFLVDLSCFYLYSIVLLGLQEGQCWVLVEMAIFHRKSSSSPLLWIEWLCSGPLPDTHIYIVKPWVAMGWYWQETFKWSWDLDEIMAQKVHAQSRKGGNTQVPSLAMSQSGHLQAESTHKAPAHQHLDFDLLSPQNQEKLSLSG